MKAAVLHQFGQAPRYEDFPDPVPTEDELLVRVKAVALENIDKMMAAGSHFASRQFLSKLPAIIGFDGIGMVANGNSPLLCVDRRCARTAVRGTADFSESADVV